MTPCFQATDVLVWHATLTISHDISCNYSYSLVDDQQNISGWKQAIAIPSLSPKASLAESLSKFIFFGQRLL